MEWRDWAQDILKLPVSWPDFYVTNAAVLVLGAVKAQVEPALPAVPLVFASLMLINAVLFHILPPSSREFILAARGRPCCCSCRWASKHSETRRQQVPRGCELAWRPWPEARC